LPDHPAGLVELAPAELNRVEGGDQALAYSQPLKTYVCVWCVSQKVHKNWTAG
jgi:hypothetical protein